MTRGDRLLAGLLAATVVVGVVLFVALLWERGEFGDSVHWSNIITCGGAIVAAGGVILVYRSVKESERTRREAEISRHATTAADFSRRWDEPEMIASRELIRSKGSPEALRTAFVQGAEATATKFQVKQYLTMQVVPNYLEDLAILLNLGALDPKFVELSLGDIVRDQWKNQWRLAADAWAERKGRDPWPNFRELAGDPTWTPSARP